MFKVRPPCSFSSGPGRQLKRTEDFESKSSKIFNLDNFNIFFVRKLEWSIKIFQKKHHFVSKRTPWIQTTFCKVNPINVYQMWISYNHKNIYLVLIFLNHFFKSWKSLAWVQWCSESQRSRSLMRAFQKRNIKHLKIFDKMFNEIKSCLGPMVQSQRSRLMRAFQKRNIQPLSNLNNNLTNAIQNANEMSRRFSKWH